MPKKLEETKEIKKKSTTTKTKTQQKKASSKKTIDSKVKKEKATNKVTTKKTSNPKTNSKKTTSKNKNKVVNKRNTQKVEKPTAVEYYDLPYTYNKTVVKVLAQTPKTLFVYWEISEEDRENFKKQYGENFFETTKPVLIIHNKTLNYSFEVEINDFANSWYLHVNDSKSDYKIELGRRSFTTDNNYIYVTSSNEIESPNDHILFDKSQNMAYFRNVKTNVTTKKDISSLSFIKNMGKIYNIYDLYKKIYKNETPSFNPSSQFK